MVIAYAAVRVDRRFYIPPGAHGEGEYSGEVVPEPPKDDDMSVYTLNPDGRTLSTLDGRTYSIADKRTWSMADASSLSQAGAHHGGGKSVDDTESVNSQSYVTINRRSGKYEMHRMPEPSLDGTTPGEVSPERASYRPSGRRQSNLSQQVVHEEDGADGAVEEPRKSSDEFRI